MGNKEEIYLVVLQKKGFITIMNPKDKQLTDKVIYEGTQEECEGVIHGKRK
jgi:hypothetical protein